MIGARVDRSAALRVGLSSRQTRWLLMDSDESNDNVATTESDDNVVMIVVLASIGGVLVIALAVGVWLKYRTSASEVATSKIQEPATAGTSQTLERSTQQC